VSIAVSEQSKTVAFMKEIFSYMNSSDSTSSLLNSIHQSLQSVIYAENFFVVLLNNSKRYVTFPFYRDVKDAMSAESLNEVPLEDIFSTLTFYAIKKKKIVCLTKCQINELLKLNKVKILGTVPEQWLCFPLQHRDIFFGNIVVQSYRSEKEYCEQDIEILSYISGVIATAIFLFNKNIELTEALGEVKEYKDQLEVKIQQRTAELENTLSSLKQEMVKSKELEKQLKYEVFHDSLSKLYNRKYLVDQIEIAASRTDRHQSNVTVAFMDLDGFKAINDKYGHECGDHVLSITAERLQMSFRRHDIVARFGGDEFVALLTSDVSEKDLKNVFTRLITLISSPIIYKDKIISVGMSVGLASSNQKEVISKHLLVQADNALYQAKNDGKGCIKFFEEKIFI